MVLILFSVYEWIAISSVYPQHYGFSYTVVVIRFIADFINKLKKHID